MARIVALIPDLMFGSRVQEALSAAGHEVELRAAADAEALSAADLIVADLAEMDPAELTGRGAPVLGFYSHVDVEVKRRAKDAGVELAVPRSRMAREMPVLVERLLGEN